VLALVNITNMALLMYIVPKYHMIVLSLHRNEIC
jgi:hypothetical protein